MAWIESHQKLEREPKMMAVANAMSWSKYECIGRLHCFWWWCVDHCEDGDLRRYNNGLLARVVELDARQASQFVDAMVIGSGTVENPDGFFERNPYFRVKNWWRYTRRFMQRRFEKTPERWQRIAQLYGEMPPESEEPPERAGPQRARSGPAADRTVPEPEPEPERRARARAGAFEKPALPPPPHRKNGFEIPTFTPLPVPLFASTAKEKIKSCEANIENIKARAKQVPLTGTVNEGPRKGERVKIPGKFVWEPAEANLAIKAWRARIEEIKLAIGK